MTCLSSPQVREALEQSAQDLGSPGRDDEFGSGLVNAPAANKALGDVLNPTNPRLTPFGLDIKPLLPMVPNPFFPKG